MNRNKLMLTFFILLLSSALSYAQELVGKGYVKNISSAIVIDSTDIVKVKSADVSAVLEGKLAGVQLSNPESFGSAPSIVLRGFSSINASVNPLIVLDGIPYNADLMHINPSDIESITVLKDAASSLLYGARAANGLIMITTKKAQSSRAKVSLDASWGFNSRALKSYDYISDPGLYYETYHRSLTNYYTMEQGLSTELARHKASGKLAAASSEDGLGYLTFDIPEAELLIGRNGKFNPDAIPGRQLIYYGDKYWVQPDNWMDALYRNSLRQEYNLNVAGNTDKAQIYASFGYLNDKGIIQAQDMKRYTARVKLDYQVKDYLKFGVNAGYANYSLMNASAAAGALSTAENAYEYAAMMAPIYPIYLRSKSAEIKTDKNGNQLFDMGDGSNAGMQRPIFTNTNALQELKQNPYKSEINSLNALGYAQLNFLRDFAFTFNAGLGFTEKSSYLNLQQLLSWNKTFADDHTVSVLAGHEWYKASGINNYDYRNEAFFVNAQYNLLNKLFATATYRSEASSYFKPELRWGNFWSVGAAWLITQDDWYTPSWLDMLKIKTSIASLGNDNFSVPSSYIGYSDLKWEKNADFNLGFDFAILGGRFSGTMEYFYRRTSDLLYFVPTYSYAAEAFCANEGKMRNSGIELTIKADIVSSEDFKWDAYINITHYTNKIKSLPELRKLTTVAEYPGYVSGYHFVAEGLSLNSFYIPMYAGVDQNNGLPLWYKDELDSRGNVLGQTVTSNYSEATNYLCGDAVPALYGGFGTSLSFADFDFSATFTYQLGGRCLDMAYAQYMTSPGETVGANFHVDILDAWTPENTDTDVPRFVYKDQDVAAVSDRFLRGASYLNIRNVQIGYTFPDYMLKRLKIERLRLYLSADNLAFLSAKRGFDPRANFNGLCSLADTPMVRTVSAGFKFTF